MRDTESQGGDVALRESILGFIAQPDEKLGQA